jgi:hypothetical protein
MGVSGKTWLMLGLALLAGGCSSGDTERLGRIGQKLASRGESITGDAGAKLTRGMQMARDGLDEPSLETKVKSRLRWDNIVGEAKIEVLAKGNDVELKGSVRDEDQRHRAMDVAQTTAGVEKVTDSLEIAKADQ